MVPGNMILNADMKMKKDARGLRFKIGGFQKGWASLLSRFYMCIHMCVFRIILCVYPGP